MYPILALLCLVFAFGVLFYTFVWIARLFAERAERAAVAAQQEAITLETDVEEDDEPAQEPSAQEQLQQKRGLLRTNATLGLILAILACVLVTFGPLVLTLSVAAFYFCGQALWLGLRYFRKLIGRALIGVVIAAVSVGLQYLALTGQLADIIPILA